MKSVRYPRVIRDPETLDFDELNHSELVAIARFNEIEACRGTPREVIVQHLQELEPIDEQDPYVPIREQLHRWMTYHWNTVKSAVGTKFMPERLVVPEHIPDKGLVSNLEVLALWAQNEHQITVR